MNEQISAFARYNQRLLPKQKAVKKKIPKKCTTPAHPWDDASSSKKLCLNSNGSSGEASNDSAVDLNYTSVGLERKSSKERKLKKKLKKLGAKKDTLHVRQSHIENEEECPMLVDSSTLNETDFTEKATQIVQWMVLPMKLPDFFQAYWENKPLHIKRKNMLYYKHLLTTERLDEILRKNSLYYTRNVDIVSYVNGKRETHNPEGSVRAMPLALWDAYNDGCSIRILNPQTYCSKLQTLVTTLQEYFGTMVGVNLYLTPPESQGFAPHYDDIEAFVLQLEGRKQWNLYSPISPSEVLPRYSSKNFDHAELGPPLKSVTLEAGDVLYFPRGMIHEAKTDSQQHSLHITISVYQQTSYADLMEHVLKDALKEAIKKDLDFRKGLPLQYLKHTGIANTHVESNIRNQVVNHVQNLMQKLIHYVQPDSAADQLGKKFMWDSMPPVPTEKEKCCMVHYDGDHMKAGHIINRVEVELDTRVRLLRYHCLRLVQEDNATHIYYCTDNAKVYHNEEQMSLEIEESFVPAIQTLIHAYPKYTTVDSLPVPDDAKVKIVTDLWCLGLLVTQRPLNVIDDDQL